MYPNKCRFRTKRGTHPPHRASNIRRNWQYHRSRRTEGLLEDNTNVNQDGIEGKRIELDDDDTHRPNYSGCRYIDGEELTYLLWATRLEMLVATKHFGISWKRCFAWSKAACRIARLLGKEGLDLYQKHMALYDDHLADLGRSDTVFFQKWRRSALTLKDIPLCLTTLDGSQDRETKERFQTRLCNAMAQAIRKGEVEFLAKPSTGLTSL